MRMRTFESYDDIKQELSAAEFLLTKAGYSGDKEVAAKLLVAKGWRLCPVPKDCRWRRMPKDVAILPAEESILDSLPAECVVLAKLACQRGFQATLANALGVGQWRIHRAIRKLIVRVALDAGWQP